jgi:death on curing protein
VTDPFFLSVDDVLSLHADQLERYGGLPGVRDAGALEAAVETPRATFGGECLHSDLSRWRLLTLSTSPRARPS